MSQVTVHAHPEGVLLKIPGDMPINRVNIQALGLEIGEVLGARFRASLAARSFVELVQMRLWMKPSDPEAFFLDQEVSERLERLSAHDRIRLGMVK
jgi:hypothetical protein